MKFLELFKMLLEMPQMLQKPLEDPTDDNFITDDKEFVENINLGGIPLSVWDMGDGRKYSIFLFLDENNKKMAEVSVEYRKNNGIQIEFMQQRPEAKGLMRKIYLEYFLNKFPYILSDSEQTKMGFEFYKKLADVIIPDKRYKIQVWDNKADKIYKVHSRDELHDYYDLAEHYKRYNFIISKKSRK